MTEWYRIKYTLGSLYSEILVYAHDEKEAEKLAEIQVKNSKKSKAGFKIISAGKEGEDSDSLAKQLEKFKIKKS